MSAPLNIPLNAAPTTRRDTRRVVAITGGIVLGILFGIIVFRAPFVVSHTKKLAPDHTITTVRILKTRATKRILSEHIGSASLFPGSVLTWNDALNASKHEISMYLLDNGTVAFGIDAPLPRTLLQRAENFGMNVTTVDGVSLVGSSDTIFPTIKASSWAFASLLPWHQGEIIQKNASGSIAITKKGIAFSHAGFVAENDHPIAADNTYVRAHLSLSPGIVALPESMLPLSLAPLGGLMEHITTFGGHLLLFSDDQQDIGFSFSTPSSDITSEMLAAIGKDIMNRLRLSTRVLTLSDGSHFSELFGDSEGLTVDIRAEDNFGLITLADGDGRTVVMTRTPETLHITNRQIDVEKGAKTYSSCLRSAHTWLQTSLFDTGAAPSTNDHDALLVFIQAFSEIAISDTKVRLCW